MSTNSFVKSLIESVYQGPLTVEGTASILKVKVDNREKVKADLYAHLKKNKVAFTDEKTKHSSFNSTIMKTPDNRAITIVYKETKGGGSGAGAAVTAMGESAQAWFTAVAFNSKLESLDDFMKNYKSISNKCFTTDQPDKFLTLPEDWIESSIKIANFMKGMSQFRDKMKSYRFHRGSDVVDKISSMFNSANRDYKLFANINKWSPADIWLMTPAGEKAINTSTATSWGQLNKLITDLYESGDAIGVSLKKVGTTAHSEVFNYKTKAAKTRFKSFKISEKSKDGYILFEYKDDPNMSIQFRSFSDTGGWQGEIKGKYASGGKIGGGQIAQIVEKRTNILLSAASANAIATKVKANDKMIADSINKNAKKLKIKVIDPVLQGSDWRYSKFLTLDLLAAFDAVSNDKKEAILRDIISYAASASENSAVFVKIS